MTQRITRRFFLAALPLAAGAPALAQRERDYDVPFVATPHSLVERMLDLARLTREDFLIDLGCGDGRIAVAAGRRGARALGIDIDPLRIAEANAAAQLAGVGAHVAFRRQDLFATLIGDASVVALYLLPAINLRLRPRLLTDLRPGTRIVSHAFGMGDWAPDGEEEHDGRRIFLWVVPGTAGGSWAVTGRDGSYRLLELEQTFQTVSGTLSGGGTSVSVRGRIAGDRLVFSAGGEPDEARIEPDRLVALDGRWEALRA